MDGILDSSEAEEQVFEVVDYAVEEFVHEFRFLLFGHVDDGFEALAGEPAGLGMGAATDWMSLMQLALKNCLSHN